MFKIRIIAVGSLKKGPEFDLFTLYADRMREPIQLVEIKSCRDFQKHIPAKSYVIACDERGEDLTTIELYNQFSLHSSVTFLIGADDGFPKDLLFQKKISFGRMTWPHLLVRGLLMEQLYRCQQIFYNHPYHRY